LTKGLGLRFLDLEFVRHLLQTRLHFGALSARGIRVLGGPFVVTVLDHLPEDVYPLLQLDHLRVLRSVAAECLLELPLVFCQPLLERTAVYGGDHYHLRLFADQVLQPLLRRVHGLYFSRLHVVLRLLLRKFFDQHFDFGIEIVSLCVGQESLHLLVDGAPRPPCLIQLGAVVFVGVLSVLPTHRAAAFDKHRSDLVGDGGGRLRICPDHSDLEHV